MSRSRGKAPRRAAVVVSVAEKLRLSLAEACALCGLSPNYLRELERRDQFPPRVVVRSHGDDDGGKTQFVASEVRAWADGRDWRALVAARSQVADAS